MPSFDTVCEADFVEVKNAVENTAKEIGTRFDFKGTSAAIELKDKEITLFGDADFQLQQVEDILASDAYGALSAELRNAEANHHNLDQLLPRLIKVRGFEDADGVFDRVLVPLFECGEVAEHENGGGYVGFGFRELASCRQDGRDAPCRAGERLV